MNKARIRNLFFRNWHRDIGYFIAGILLTYAISGLALNHRKHWNPEKYTYEIKAVHIALPDNFDETKEDFVKNWLTENQLIDTYRKFRIKKNYLKIALDNGTVEVDVKTGDGEIELTRKRPIFNQMVTLHKSESDFWIWYSDLYAIAIIFMVISGLTLSKGKLSFKKRGWRLMVLGLLFPVIFLLFL